MSRADKRLERIEVVGGGAAMSVWVLTGASEGPTGLVCAGVHGDEFEGPRALQNLARSLDPAALRGRLYLVPVVNEGAFFAGTRCHPEDGKNLARVFPGDPAGTVSERLAHTFVERLLRGASFLIDVHASGSESRILPWAGYGLNPGLIEAQRAMAIAFGLDIVWGTPVNPGRTLSSAAELGIPSIYVEMPGEGRCASEDVARVEAGVRRVLALMGMCAEEEARPGPEKHPLVVETTGQDSGTLETHHLAPVAGMFIPAVSLGQWVGKGEPLGTLVDPAGRALQEVQAEEAGLVVRLRTFPVVRAGDSLATVLPAQRPG